MLDTARCPLDVGNDVQKACKLRLTNYKFARQQDEREDDWCLTDYASQLLRTVLETSKDFLRESFRLYDLVLANSAYTNSQVIRSL